MFCHQCEQTLRRDGIAACTARRGDCGKDAETSDLQDLLRHAVVGLGWWARRARALGAPVAGAAAFAHEALFTTLTNVNFDPQAFVSLLDAAVRLRDRAREAALSAGPSPEHVPAAATWVPAADHDALLLQAAGIALDAGREELGDDVVGLRALVLYGLKGTCAYAHHAAVLGHRDDAVDARTEELLALLADPPREIDALLGAALEVGSLNLEVMRVLDAANTGTFGVPVPTSVPTTPRPGPCVLVSGHDLHDLQAVLEATAGTGVQVYTHGELLPAHGYPALAAYPHLAGTYGGAWQDQRRDFARFPGPVVMTSNCLISPTAGYRERLFTLGPVAWPGVPHLQHSQLDQVVRSALASPGFAADDVESLRSAPVTVGFAADAVLAHAGTVLEAVAAGDLRHVFLVGGCDGADPARSYFTDFVRATPHDSLVLTLGCGKFRFHREDLGTVAGLPRLMDVGQCNDAYSAVRIALALAEALDCGVNDLPLSLVLSWYEQKAVAVLLTLLSLGVRGIRIGPTLPAFLTPAAVDLLAQTYGLRATGDVAADLADSLAGV